MLLMLACIAGLGATPLLIAPAGPAPAARAVQVALLGTGLCCGAQHPALSGLVEKWTLPSERRWVSAVDALSCVAGSLLNCLVIAQLARLVGWRATMLLASGLSVIALIALVGFVTSAPAARSGRLRLSDGEAALFRAEGMLADEPSPRGGKAGSGSNHGGGSHGMLASSVTWALLAIEATVAWN